MVQYTLTQSPEVILTVSGKDSPKAREKAMEQLLELMDEGKLPTDLSEGFSPQEFIEVKEPTLPTQSDEDAVTQAVQVLSNLANLKIKVQASRSEAMQVRSQIDKLFTDEEVTEDEVTDLKKGFKSLQTYAQANLRYREARAQAEEARAILDAALSSDAPIKSETPDPIAPPTKGETTEKAEKADPPKAETSTKSTAAKNGK